MTADYRPDLAHQIAWAADPNDPQAVEVFADRTEHLTAIDRLAEGRQYELGVTRVEESLYTWRDVDEYMNAANTASPFYPYQQPYRRLLSQAVWPKGSTGNLLNLDNWRVPADGSFESYAVGSTPEFLTQWNVTGAAPNVTTTNPQQGTQCLTYDIPTAAAGNRYGIEWEVPCVPGTQYTVSAYVRQTSATFQVIRLADQVFASDPFNRASAGGYGTAAAPLAVGGLWSPIGGAAGARSTVPATPYGPGYAQTALAVVNTNYWETLPISTRDVRVRTRLQVPVVATGGEIQSGVVARWVFPGSDCYEAVLIFGTDSTVTLRVGKRVATVFTSLASYTLSGVYYQPGDEFYLDFYVSGQLLRAAAWRVDQPAWDLLTDPQINVGDSSITGAGAVGLFSWLHASNTNTLPVAIRYYGFSAVGAVQGSSTNNTGVYDRLTVTFTATADKHTVNVATSAFAATTAGTVNIDAIMHNTGSAAGTFTATGSTIYPLSRRYIERFPRTFESVGFEGFCKSPTVDALAALAAIDLPSDYDYAVRSLSPDFYWRLDGAQGTTLYADATGNGNPPLGLNISKYGIGTIPSGGTAMEVPGDAGGTGVTFTPPSTPTGNQLAATVLGTGPLSEVASLPFVAPASLTGTGGIWRMTVSMWVRSTSNAADQTAFYPSKQVSSTAGAAYIPCYVGIDNYTAFSNVTAAGAPAVLTSGNGLSGIDIMDGEPHLLIGITVQDTAGDTIVYRYIDDQLDGVNTATTASLGGPLRGQTDSLSVGATDDGASFLAVVNGSISKLAVWNRELDGSETARLWEAGRGHPGITSGARVERNLMQGGYTGPARIGATTSSAVGEPVTTMQPPSWTGRIDALTDLQNTTQAELGTSWAAADGAVCFEGRQERFLRLTASSTLGEDAPLEAPYGQDVEFDYDPTFVYADVAVQRPGGGTATGGLSGDIAQARRRYFPRSFSVTVDVEDDTQAQDYADFVFYTHRAPNLRVSTITLDPASYPTLWPLVLGIQVGDRLTVKRRAKAANAGAGITMSADYFVENRTHRDINFATGTWFVDLLLSPIGTGPGPTVQPWILENTTLSVLDSTTVLGF